ncbi:MAG: Holliday junction resolvase RuvX [bacterium]
MKSLGIDFGTKRIGVAVSDETGTLAFPHSTVKAGPSALEEIVDIVKKEGVGQVVVGESHNFQGEANTVMEKVAEFKKSLENLPELAGVPVVYEKEFLTSMAAARQFAPDGSRKENPSHVKLDASAAALILQSYLDRNQRNS